VDAVTAKVAILGASSPLGLGVRGRSYGVRVGESLGPGAEILQLSRSALTVADVEPSTLEQIREFAPDLIILSFGAAEAYVHPSRFLQALLDRFAPQSWRGPGGMEPRPYYSNARLKRLRQCLVSRAKVQVKRLIIACTGGFHRLPSAEFAERLREVLDQLGPAQKVLVGLWRVDDYMFPRSNPLLARNNALARDIAAERDDVLFISTADEVRYWDDFLADHAHLNDHGHDRIAEMILEATRSDRLTGTKPPC
jgi:lysophospholipase L1-like esterase